MTDDHMERIRDGQPVEPVEERYTQELLTLTRGFDDVLLSYKNEVRREKIGLGTQAERLLLNMAETCDGLAAYIRRYEGKNVEGFEWVQAIHADLLQKMERAGVTSIRAEKGDPYDEVRHEIINPEARPTDFKGRPAIGSVAMPGYLLKNKVLRRARVEVSWKE
jgi:molecular chaperone GrpE (heat shock protein)